MAQTRKMESSNGLLVTVGGVVVFINWYFMEIPWALDGVLKMVMSLIYGGVGAYGAYFTRKYIIVHVEKHGGFWKWIKAIIVRKNPTDEEPPKQ